MKHINRLILVILFFGSANMASALDPKGSTFSHDPATLIKDGDTYWHFFTAPGVGAASSNDMVNWSSSNNHIFEPGSNWKSNYPEWTIPYFGSGSSANTDGNLWAPDVIYMNGAYYLYYSCSSFGSSNSAIGCVRSTSLNNPNWEDMGKVVSSSSRSDINAIDPAMFKDDDGKIYMTYGSWSGGVGIVEIDTVSGLATTSVKHLAGGGGSSYEAPALFKADGYYYLTINRGTCCNGLNSSYYIIVGRSTNVNGTYGEFRTLLPNKDGKYVGPGHFSLYRDNCADYVTTHYYDGSANGFPRYDLLRMKMVDGWPALYRDFAIDNCNDNVNISKTPTNSNTFPKILSYSAEAIGNPVSKLLDGNNGDVSRWSAEGFPQSVVIDYGESKSITGIKLWTNQDRAYQYTVELDDDASFPSPYTIDRASNTSSDKPITDDFESVSARYVRIVVTGAASYSGPWMSLNEFAIEEDTSTITSVWDQSTKDNFINLYPNPAASTLNIELSEKFDSNTRLTIYDMSGQMVYHMRDLNQKTMSLELSILKKGIYSVVVSNQHFTSSERFVKH